MRTARNAALGALAFFLGCGESKPVAPFRQLDSTFGEKPISDPPVDAHAMQGLMIRDAVVRGDLDETKKAANALVALVSKHEAPTPESRLEAMVIAAHRVAEANTMNEAARSFAFLAERCGECHVATRGPASGPATPPPETLGLTPRMRRHQWGAARLWEGLVAPSDEAWLSGARVLADAPLTAEQTLAGRTPVPEIATLAASVHELGLDATHATKASTRIGIYGEVLTTCATCHTRVGGGPR